MKVLILYNIARDVKKGDEQDLICEQEISIIVPLVSEALSLRGHDAQAMETTFDAWEHLKAKKGTFDIVFNLAEAFGGTNKHETLIPAMLEVLEIPFTGATAQNMHLTLDKEKTKLAVLHYGIPVPEYQIMKNADDALQSHLRFPLIVKPIREEASIGIQIDSVVNSPVSLREKVALVLDKYSQPALVEQFIIGREISVGIVGNPPDLTVFPPLEFIFPEAGSAFEQIRSYEYKWGGRKEQMIRASLSDQIIARLTEYTKTAYLITECRDYARMDYRIDNQGNIYLLEVNYNPGIGPNTHGLNNTLTMMASFVGHSFEDLLEQILLIAAKRYEIEEKSG